MLRELLAHLRMLLTKNRVTMSDILTIPREDSYYQIQGSVDAFKNLINQLMLRYSD